MLNYQYVEYSHLKMEKWEISLTRKKQPVSIVFKMIEIGAGNIVWGAGYLKNIR